MFDGKIFNKHGELPLLPKREKVAESRMRGQTYNSGRTFNNFLFTIFLIAIYSLCFSNSALAQKNHQNTPFEEYTYQQKILRKIEKEKYERSLLPQSGFMTKEEYESLSKDNATADIKIPEPKLPKDIKMKYVPQPTFKLARYNTPPGTAEINILRRFKYDRTLNAHGITSPDRTMMVYPALHYYADSQCVSTDLYVVPLEQMLPDVDRISRGNVAQRWAKPILSTSKDISEKYTFRTITPVDFSPDSLRLAAKEKIGNNYDGIWKTNLWVYDFETKTAKNLIEVRDAIRHYWLETKSVYLDDRRWDIYPLGFDAADPNRIIVAAYGFTGTTPKFLGTWSIDYKGERTMLVSLFDPEAQVSINGFKLVREGVVNPAEIIADEKKQDAKIKKARKAEKKARNNVKKQGKQALNRKIKEMKKEEKQIKKTYDKQNRVSKPTGVESNLPAN